MLRSKYKILIITAIISIILSIITFSPLVIPANKFRPVFAGMPYTLWTGIVMMILFIIITIVAALFHPGENNDR